MNANSKPLQRVAAALRVWLLSAIAILWTIAIVPAPAWATGVADLPDLTAGSATHVVDTAEVISRANQGKIDSALQQLAKANHQDVRLVAIRRLNYGETIDSFADRLFENWYPTPEARANQTLLVMDTLTNSVTLRRGEVAKAQLNDDIAESVVSETVSIPLRNGGKYNEALLGASDRLVAVLSGQADPGPPQEQDINIDSTYASAEETDDGIATVWVIVLLGLATLIPMVTYFWYVGLPGR
jgi:uncharacterized protein